MQIREIQMKDFRNYGEILYRPQEGVNVLIGKNAQGKTNLLEGVYLCCIGKSHRTPRDVELIRDGAQEGYCAVDVARRDGPRKVEVLLSRAARKRIRVWGVPITRMSQLMGHINCVFFSPEDLQLIKGGPAARRRFLDITLCQLYPGYFTALYQYNSALGQRNAILKRYERADAPLLEAFDAAMAEYGGQIVARRRGFIRRLRGAAALSHSAVGGGEELDLAYRTQAEGESAAECAQSLLALFSARREEDVRRHQTTAGPHRDDILVEIAKRDGRVYASQGQQRTAALALKLGAMELMGEETGEAPILMLDDVLSELDESRQRALLRCIRGQAFITAAAPLSWGKEAAVVRVSGGALTPR